MINLIKKNAVLYKEMTVDMKKPKVLIISVIFNALVTLIASAFLVGIDYAGLFGGNVSYRVLTWLFIALVSIEGFLILMLLPPITAVGVSLEKERQTLDVLLTTRMTPWEIIKGKYLSNVVFISLLILSTVPTLSLVYIYGGIAFWQLAAVVLGLICMTLYVSSFGIFFSSLTKNTVSAIILTYVFLGGLIGVTFSVSFIGPVIIELINDFIRYDMKYKNFELWWDFFPCVLYWNPVVFLFDLIGNSVGISIDGESVQGMRFVADDLCDHITDKNLLYVLWTPISMLLQLPVAYGLLRLSAALLNPLKGRKKTKKNKKAVQQKQPAQARQAQPTAEAAEPVAETSEPAAETSEPVAETSEPVAETSEPAAETQENTVAENEEAEV